MLHRRAVGHRDQAHPARARADEDARGRGVDRAVVRAAEEAARTDVQLGQFARIGANLGVLVIDGRQLERRAVRQHKLRRVVLHDVHRAVLVRAVQHERAGHGQDGARHLEAALQRERAGVVLGEAALREEEVVRPGPLAGLETDAELGVGRDLATGDERVRVRRRPAPAVQTEDERGVGHLDLPGVVVARQRVLVRDVEVAAAHVRAARIAVRAVEGDAARGAAHAAQAARARDVAVHGAVHVRLREDVHVAGAERDGARDAVLGVVAAAELDGRAAEEIEGPVQRIRHLVEVEQRAVVDAQRVRRSLGVGRRRLAGPVALLHVDRHRPVARRERDAREADEVAADLLDAVAVHRERAAAEVPAADGLALRATAAAEDDVARERAVPQRVELALAARVDDRAAAVRARAGDDHRPRAEVDRLVGEAVRRDVERRAVLDHEAAGHVPERAARDAEPERALLDDDVAREVGAGLGDRQHAGAALLERAPAGERRPERRVGRVPDGQHATVDGGPGEARQAAREDRRAGAVLREGVGIRARDRRLDAQQAIGSEVERTALRRDRARARDREGGPAVARAERADGEGLARAEQERRGAGDVERVAEGRHGVRRERVVGVGRRALRGDAVEGGRGGRDRLAARLQGRAVRRLEGDDRTRRHADPVRGDDAVARLHGGVVGAGERGRARLGTRLGDVRPRPRGVGGLLDIVAVDVRRRVPGEREVGGSVDHAARADRGARRHLAEDGDAGEVPVVLRLLHQDGDPAVRVRRGLVLLAERLPRAARLPVDVDVRLGNDAVEGHLPDAHARAVAAIGTAKGVLGEMELDLVGGAWDKPRERRRQARAPAFELVDRLGRPGVRQRPVDRVRARAAQRAARHRARDIPERQRLRRVHRRARVAFDEAISIRRAVRRENGRHASYESTKKGDIEFHGIDYPICEGSLSRQRGHNSPGRE